MQPAKFITHLHLHLIHTARCIDHAWNIRPKFGVEDQPKAYKDYKIHFARDLGFACLHYRLDSTITLWFCSTR